MNINMNCCVLFHLVMVAGKPVAAGSQERGEGGPLGVVVGAGVTCPPAGGRKPAGGPGQGPAWCKRTGQTVALICPVTSACFSTRTDGGVGEVPDVEKEKEERKKQARKKG